MTIEVPDSDKLKVIEFYIEQWRPVREDGDASERYLLKTLKAIADDIRARGKTSDTITRMEQAIKNAKTKKTSAGYEPGNLREIAELTIGRWPTIKQALEKFE